MQQDFPHGYTDKSGLGSGDIFPPPLSRLQKINILGGKTTLISRMPFGNEKTPNNSKPHVTSWKENDFSTEEKVIYLLFLLEPFLFLPFLAFQNNNALPQSNWSLVLNYCVWEKLANQAHLGLTDSSCRLSWHLFSDIYKETTLQSRSTVLCEIGSDESYQQLVKIALSLLTKVLAFHGGFFFFSPPSHLY